MTEYGMVPCDGGILAGLSGGADSVCLLLALHELSAEMGFGLAAVHVNHCLRGEESDRDERFCVELCRKLDIPIECVRVDVRGYAAEKRCSCEEGARKLRYDAFAAAADKFGCEKIATAHNLCDNSETSLFNAARGTGLKGLSGIPYVRGRIIRPLIEVSRQEIEQFLEENGQGYVTDSTNLTDDYSRNVIRHRVIPALESINGGVHTALLRLRKSAAEDEDFILSEMMKLREDEICRAHPAVRKRYIRMKLNDSGMPVSAERIALLDDMMTDSFQRQRRYLLSGDIYAVFRNGIMTVERMEKLSGYHNEFEIDLSEDSEIYIPEFDKTVKISGISDDKCCGNCNVNKKLTNNCGNYAKIQGVAVLRTKRDGDMIQLKGRGFRTKLKKYYSGLGLSPEERRSALVMEDETGLIWSEYGGVAERIAAGDEDRGSLFRITVISGKDR
ncbi:MAG: tRNA lysidine(34) synthetase TilS [Huintestinicola sp.]